jgi:outer membrane biosynthesis protein TonB
MTEPPSEPPEPQDPTLEQQPPAEPPPTVVQPSVEEPATVEQPAVAPLAPAEPESHRTIPLWAAALAALLVAAIAGVTGFLIGDGDDDEQTAGTSSSTSSSTTASSSTTSTSTTTSSTSSTTTTIGSTTTTLTPGQTCALGSHRDCIDPDGDGQGEYLIGGGDCMETFADSPELCSDLDCDGNAGYPDSG